MRNCQAFNNNGAGDQCRRPAGVLFVWNNHSESPLCRFHAAIYRDRDLGGIAELDGAGGTPGAPWPASDSDTGVNEADPPQPSARSRAHPAHSTT
jgi:hypothetical protein